MSPDHTRWALVRDAVEGALAVPESERDAYVVETSGDDPALLAEIRRLLAACIDAGETSSFLATPASSFAAPLLAEVDADRQASRDNVLLTLREGLASAYAVEREVGAGGMATVYLAIDLKHQRRVAIKVLRPDLAATVGAERFLAEIRVMAGLQHANLLSLFDSGAVNGLLYYVMPFVEGESLRTRLDREKQLPVDEAVRLGVAIAGALDYAHRHGVVHRDLKPENILLHEGQPLVADFGIALALSSAGADRLTLTGLSLGTPKYMSPEQATGDRAIDARSDIYALGCVLYEMLSGDPPHTGSTAQAVLRHVATEEPRPLRGERPSVPIHVEAAVHRALARVPADRFATARELADTLANGVDARGLARSGRTPSRAPWKRDLVRAGLIVAGLVIAATAGVYLTRTRGAAPERAARFVISALSDAQRGGVPTLTPDGQHIVYIGSAGMRHAILVRGIDELTARPLAGKEGAISAFVSPDGKRIGFVTTDDQLRTIPLDGGTSVLLASVFRYSLAKWSSAHSSIIDTYASGGLHQLPDTGG
ncbi:MAG: serine/threonine-protein kinase, partial [bacterium]